MNNLLIVSLSQQKDTQKYLNGIFVGFHCVIHHHAYH